MGVRTPETMTTSSPIPHRTITTATVVTMYLRGVLFDLDDTLLQSRAAEEAGWEAVAAALAARVPGLDVEELRRRYVDTLERHWHPCAAGEIDVLAFRWNRLEEALAPWAALDQELFDTYSLERERTWGPLELFPDALDTVRGLRARGLRIGVLTNGPGEGQRRKLASFGLVGELDAIAISGELGVAKPDARAFHAAARLLGLLPAEVAMVGDNLVNDVGGALAAGLGAAVWVEQPAGQCPPGARLARELAEVPRILGLV
jgi:putative hydrolase of the HAD superfamily